MFPQTTNFTRTASSIDHGTSGHVESAAERVRGIGELKQGIVLNIGMLA